MPGRPSWRAPNPRACLPRHYQASSRRPIVTQRQRQAGRLDALDAATGLKAWSPDPSAAADIGSHSSPHGDHSVLELTTLSEPPDPTKLNGYETDAGSC